MVRQGACGLIMNLHFWERFLFFPKYLNFQRGWKFGNLEKMEILEIIPVFSQISEFPNGLENWKKRKFWRWIPVFSQISKYPMGLDIWKIGKNANFRDQFLFFPEISKIPKRLQIWKIGKNVNFGDQFQICPNFQI